MNKPVDMTKHLNKMFPSNFVWLWLFQEYHTAVSAPRKVGEVPGRLGGIVACRDLLFEPLCSFQFLFTTCFSFPCLSLLLVPEHYQMSVLESAPVSSTVGRVVAKDLDEGINAEMKYSLVDGDGLDVFDINTDPNYQVGIITVRKVVKFIFIVIYMTNSLGYILCVQYSLMPVVTWFPLHDSSPFPAIKHRFFNNHC